MPVTISVPPEVMVWELRTAPSTGFTLRPEIVSVSQLFVPPTVTVIVTTVVVMETLPTVRFPPEPDAVGGEPVSNVQFDGALSVMVLFVPVLKSPFDPSVITMFPRVVYEPPPEALAALSADTLREGFVIVTVASATAT